jgi:hypothetical protein
MSRTKKTIKKGRPKGRGNPLGLCMCVHCKRGRLGKKLGMVEKIKHKQKVGWKTNKQETRGAYT